MRKKEASLLVFQSPGKAQVPGTSERRDSGGAEFKILEMMKLLNDNEVDHLWSSISVGSASIDAVNLRCENIQGKNILESYPEQNLNVPSTGYCLHSICIVSGIINDLEMV